MKAIYPVSILIISLIICYVFFRKQKIIRKNNSPKVIENFRNTTDFNDPSFKFFKALNDIKTSDKIVLDNVVSKCYLTLQTIDCIFLKF